VLAEPADSTEKPRNLLMPIKMKPSQAKKDNQTDALISTRTELKQVEERLAIGANVVYETIRREGEDEMDRPAAALAWFSARGWPLPRVFFCC
jgi:hypothetical protein